MRSIEFVYSAVQPEEMMKKPVMGSFIEYLRHPLQSDDDNNTIFHSLAVSVLLLS